MTDPALEVRLLGGFEVRDRGGVVAVSARKDRWLLAMLLLARGRPRRRRDLQDALWPDQGFGGDPAFNLRRSLTQLRRALLGHAHRIQSPTRSEVRFDGEGVWVDALAFDADVASDDPERWMRAVQGYGGDLLPECDEVWVLAERQHRRLRFRERVATLTERALADAGPDRATLAGVVAQDPEWEEGCRLRMRLLAALERPDDALEAYHAFVALLRRNDPRRVSHPDTLALAQRIRDQARAGGRQRPSGATRGLLPHPDTALVARDAEVARVGALLEHERLVTLTGPGGVGKTRLALQVAHDRAAAFADGACWVELAPVPDSALVAATVADAIGVRAQGGRSLSASVADALRERELLLVLDNGEHVSEGVSEFCAHLLRDTAGVRVLVTARGRLSVAGERVLRVAPLTVPQVGADPASLLSCGAVRLFVARAEAVRPEFALTPRNASLVAAVCRRLDGVPLAIDLAAARMGVMGLEEIHARLEDSLHLLAGGPRTAPARHRTLRALIEGSVALRTEPERTLLRRLSVFAGGWSLEAAEAVCGGDGIQTEVVLDLLAALVDTALVEVREEGADTRYHLLETIRQHAAAQLSECGETAAARRRHARWCLALAEETARTFGPHDPSAAPVLEREMGNLRAALGAAVDGVIPVEEAMRLVGALGFFWELRGHYAEARRWLSALLERESATAEVRCHLGMLAFRQSDYGEARTHFDAALAGFRAQGDRARVASVQLVFGMVPQMQGDYREAAGRFREALAFFRESGDRAGEALCTFNLGDCLLFAGDYDRAEPLLLRARDLCMAIRHRDWEGYCVHSLAAAALRRGDRAAGRRLLEEAWTIHRATGNRFWEGQDLNSLGWADLEVGDIGAAAAHLSAALSADRETGHRLGVVHDLEGLAAVASANGRGEASAFLLASAERLREEMGTPVSPWEADLAGEWLSAIRARLGQEEIARAWARGRAATQDEAVAVAFREADA